MEIIVMVSRDGLWGDYTPDSPDRAELEKRFVGMARDELALGFPGATITLDLGDDDRIDVYPAPADGEADRTRVGEQVQADIDLAWNTWQAGL